MKKYYRLYIYIDTDGDFSFEKNTNWQEYEYSLLFNSRKQAGVSLWKELNHIFNTLTETTPDDVKERMSEKMQLQENVIKLSDKDISCDCGTGNATIYWCIQEIEEKTLILEDTKESIQAFLIKNPFF